VCLKLYEILTLISLPALLYIHKPENVVQGLEHNKRNILYCSFLNTFSFFWGVRYNCVNLKKGSFILVWWQGFGLDIQGIMVQLLPGVRNVLFLKIVQICCGAIPVGMRGSFLGCKVVRVQSWPLVPLVPRLKTEWSYFLLSYMPSWHVHGQSYLLIFVHILGTAMSVSLF